MLTKNSQSIYEFSGFNGAPSICRFRFSKTVTGLVLCIADELPTNKGTPIRDFAEHLATHAYREIFAPNGAHFGDFLYVEHAPISPTSVEYGYELVDFDWDSEGMQFVHPTRTVLTNEEIEALLGETEEDGAGKAEKVEEPSGNGSPVLNSVVVESEGES